MNTLNSLSLTLFESTNANFRLTTNVMFNKENSQTKVKYPLIKVTQSGNAKCEPSTFLVFTYTEGSFESDVSVYTSNPHLLKIRSILEDLKEGFLSDQAFIQTENGLVVADDYVEPRSIAHIGSQGKWIAFRFVADAIVDNNNNNIPAVEITLANAPKACILTIDEFLSIYTIINDLSLPQMALIASVAALNSRNDQPVNQNRGGYNNAYANANSNYGNNYTNRNQQPRQYNTNYGQPQNSGFAQRGQNAQPQTGHTETVRPTYASNVQYEPKVAPTMQPRSAKPSMSNVQDIENIEVQYDDFSFGDDDISELFDSSN